MITGNRPADGGHLLLDDRDREAFIQADPLSERHIRPFVGADEFINGTKRWCLWLVGVSASDLRRMPLVMQRIAACKKNRENAVDKGRRNLARTPSLFRETNHPSECLVVPIVSSARRPYIPMGFLTTETVASNLLLLIPNATMYHLGILTSSVHMEWVRTVCGRLGLGYRYSRDIVYNNFPWPVASEPDRLAIEQLAQAILDARGLYPGRSLAELYAPLTMPEPMKRAHANLDGAVMGLYGFSTKDTSEMRRIAALMERYRLLAESGRAK